MCMCCAVSGLIGAGKSTLATALAKKLNLPVYYEPVSDNEYLEDFYKVRGFCAPPVASSSRAVHSLR